MGILSRATRNISRRKTRSILVIVVLSFALAMLISIPPSITASKATTQQTIDNLTATAKAVDLTISTVATEIDCHLPGNALMNETDYTNLTPSPDVTAVIPILDQGENDSNFVYNVYGVPLDNASLLSKYSLVLPSNITAGKICQAGDNGVVVLQSGLQITSMPKLAGPLHPESNLPGDRHRGIRAAQRNRSVHDIEPEAPAKCERRKRNQF